MEEFTQLLCHEREKIYRGLCEGRSQRSIAKQLGRTPSTISREIRRNSDTFGYLYPEQAHKKAQKRKRINKPKIDENPELVDFIVNCLNKNWSPKTIAASWNQQEYGVKVSVETIYKWVYNKKNRKNKLYKLLVRSHIKRGFRRKTKSFGIKNRVSIHVRPSYINDRSEYGHYEGDLMFNSGSQSFNICNLVERTSRESILIRNKNKQSNIVVDAIIDYIKTTGLFVLSITFDNGKEFANHHKLTDELGIKVYFCDPGAPWQKGAVEHNNGMLRRYLPFNMPSQDITDDLVAEVNQKINNMPREILGYKTPFQVGQEMRCALNYELGESRVKPALPAVKATKQVFNQKNQSVAIHS